MNEIDRDKKKERQIRVAVYLRVSTEDQGEKYGLDMQREAILNYLKSRGHLEDGREKMVLAGEEFVYIDNGISGTKPIEERKDFWRLKEDITMYPTGECPFDAVAVYKIDRLARKLTVLLDIVKLFDKHEIEMISVNESIDTSTPFGRAILGIMGVIAELEVETIKQRSTGGKIAAIHKGRYIWTPPYGYKKDENLHLYEFKKESKYVKDIFRWFVFENKSTSEIAEFLETNKIVSPEVSIIKNKKKNDSVRKINNDYFWRVKTVKEILSNEAYIGKFWFGKSKDGKLIPKEKWQLSEHRLPVLVEETVFFTAKKKLQDSVNRVLLSRKRENDSLYLLSGLVKCGWCQKHSSKKEGYVWIGDKKKIKKTGNYSYYYKCGRKNTSKFDHTCPTIPVPAEQLESYIVSFVKNLLNNPVRAFKYQQKLKSNKLLIRELEEEREELTKFMNNISKRKENLSSQHEMGLLTDELLKDKLRDVQKDIRNWNFRLNDINKELGKQALSNGYIRSFEEYTKRYKSALEDISNNKKEIYTLVHSIIEEIIVDTRDYNPEIDNISGRKKENQQIPNSITIKLKLPEELLSELVNQEIKKTGDKFGVKNSVSHFI